MNPRNIVSGMLITFIVLLISTCFLISKNVLNIITGLLFLATLDLFILLLGELLLKIARSGRETKNNIRLMLSTICVLIIVVELFLRFGLGSFANYAEKNSKGLVKNYVSPYPKKSRTSWYHVHRKNIDHRDSKVEFIHSRKTNSLGLSEQEFSRDKSPNEYRIIALGDSFTEGVGTTYENTWVKVAERKLSMAFTERQITTMNAGVSGSDPFFSFILLREKLVRYQPDLVILALNLTDIHDIIFRGGMERFQADGTTLYSSKPPSWEWLYAISFISRPIVHKRYSWLLIKNSKMGPLLQSSGELLATVIDQFEQLSDEKNFRFLVVIHPLMQEINKGEYGPGLRKVISQLEKKNQVLFVDLLDQYQSNNLLNKKNADEYFWPNDAHHNIRGYEVMGTAIADSIVQMHLIRRNQPAE